jgi:hypothetical protein
MESGSQIINYKGDANVALGTSASTPVATSDLNVINDTAKNMMLMNHENNLKMFSQKVQDRDTLLGLIAEGQVNAGYIDPKFKPEYEKAQKKTNDALFEMTSKGGINNKDANQKYRESLKELKDVVTIAQSKTLGLTNLKNAAAKETIPYKRDLIENHIKKQYDKNFYDLVDPFQESLSWDADSMFNTISEGSLGGSSSYKSSTSTTTKGSTVSSSAASGSNTIVAGTSGAATGTQVGAAQVGAATTKGSPTSTTVSTTSKKNGVSTTTKTTTAAPKPVKGVVPISGNIIKKDGKTYSVSEQSYSFNKMKQNAINAYLDKSGLQTAYQNQYRDYVETAPDYIASDIFNNIISKAEQYNQQRQLSTNSEDYIDVNKIKKAFGIDLQTGELKKNPQTGTYQIGLSTPEFAALAALARVDGGYVSKQEEWMQGQDVFDYQKKASDALAAQRKANAHLTNVKSKTLQQQWNPIQTFNSIFGGRMYTEDTQNGNRVTRINAADLSPETIKNLGLDPLSSKGFYNLVPVNVRVNGKTINTDDNFGAFNLWLKKPEAEELSMKLGTKNPDGSVTPKFLDIFDFMYSQNANFEVGVMGKVPAVTKKIKVRKGENEKIEEVVENKDAGQVRISDRLESLINQRRNLNIKGTSFIATEPSSSEEGSQDDFEITKK